METNKIFEAGITDWKDRVDQVSFTQDTWIFKCLKGQAKILIQSNLFELNENIMFSIREFVLFKIIEVSEDFSIQYCRFPMTLLNEIYARVNDKVLKATEQVAPYFYIKDNRSILNNIFESLIMLSKRTDYTYYNEMTICLLLSFTYELYEQNKHQSNRVVIQPASEDSFILNRFYELILKYHNAHHDSKFYAEQLNISERYLYKIVMNNINVTPKQMIDYYLVAVIRKLVLATPLTLNEIANKLNFKSLSALSTYYKRNTGRTLMEERKESTNFTY